MTDVPILSNALSPEKSLFEIHGPQFNEHSGEASAETKGYFWVLMVYDECSYGKNVVNIFDSTVYEAKTYDKKVSRE